MAVGVVLFKLLKLWEITLWGLGGAITSLDVSIQTFDVPLKYSSETRYRLVGTYRYPYQGTLYSSDKFFIDDEGGSFASSADAENALSELRKHGWVYVNPRKPHCAFAFAGVQSRTKTLVLFCGLLLLTILQVYLSQ
jgi:hypothetical protein